MVLGAVDVLGLRLDQRVELFFFLAIQSFFYSTVCHVALLTHIFLGSIRRLSSNRFNFGLLGWRIAILYILLVLEECSDSSSLLGLLLILFLQIIKAALAGLIKLRVVLGVLVQAVKLHFGGVLVVHLVPRVQQLPIWHYS